MFQPNLIQLIRDQNEEIIQLQRDLLHAEEKNEKIKQDHKSILVKTKCFPLKKGYRQAENELASVFHAELYKSVKFIEDNSGEVLLTRLYQDNIELRNLLDNFIEN